MAEDGPSSRNYAPFYCEAATVQDVNRQNWTCTVMTTYSSKTFRDVQWASPYHHYLEGEGYHFMPEPGARCYLALPNDESPAFIMAFVAPPAKKEAQGDTPLRPDAPNGGGTDVSYQSKRLDLNPGDLAMTTRDGNFLILRRGGVVQIGATPLAQRVIVPVRNFVHDYAENYELATPAGDVTWIIDRGELDPTGQPAASYTFHMREFATDANATVRIRHLPLAGAGAPKSAWEIHVSPNGINTSTGSVRNATYSMMVLTDGTKTELIGASRSVQVKGNDNLTVDGAQTITVTKDHKLSAQNITSKAKAQHVLEGKVVKVGDATAASPAVLGNMLIAWLSSATVMVPPGAGGGPAPFNPAQVAQLQNLLSKVVYLK